MMMIVMWVVMMMIGIRKTPLLYMVYCVSASVIIIIITTTMTISSILTYLGRYVGARQEQHGTAR